MSAGFVAHPDGTVEHTDGTMAWDSFQAADTQARAWSAVLQVEPLVKYSTTDGS